MGLSATSMHDSWWIGHACGPSPRDEQEGGYLFEKDKGMSRLDSEIKILPTRELLRRNSKLCKKRLRIIRVDIEYSSTFPILNHLMAQRMLRLLRISFGILSGVLQERRISERDNLVVATMFLSRDAKMWQRTRFEDDKESVRM